MMDTVFNGQWFILLGKVVRRDKNRISKTDGQTQNQS